MLLSIVRALASLALAAPGGLVVPVAAATPVPAASVEGARAVASGTGVPEGSWCRTVLPKPSRAATKARQIMAGRVDLGMYGWFTLGPEPSWKPSSTLDASGNTHMHGLHWAVPLLYEGMATGTPMMVARFYAIVGSWLERFPPDRPRTSSQDQPIIAGERLWTLTCAAELATAAGENPQFWASAAETEARRQVDRFRITRGTNNTALHAQSGALAAFCRQGEPLQAAVAMAHLSALADYLVLADGSDREGSPHYAYYTYQLMRTSAQIADKCAMPNPRLDAAMERVTGFLAHATDPSGKLETLGDSPGSRMNPSILPQGSAALFVASAGQAGVAPSHLYRTFLGGYAFGRSSWTARAGVPATFYSVRTGRGPTPTAHAHNDIGSITINAKGVEWVGDPGPWRYDRSPLRSAIVGRAAHSATTVKPLRPRAPAAPPSPPSPTRTATPSPTPTTNPTVSVSPQPSPSPTKPPVWKPPIPKPDSRVTRARSNSRRDVTCIDDLTYPTVRLSRCVTFRRNSGVIIIEDRMTALARSEVASRWQIPNGVKVTRKGGKVTLRSGGSRAELALSGDPSGRVTTSRAWFTVRYGVKAAGTTITRSVVLEKGRTATWRTTFSVR